MWKKIALLRTSVPLFSLQILFEAFVVWNYLATSADTCVSFYTLLCNILVFEHEVKSSTNFYQILQFKNALSFVTSYFKFLGADAQTHVAKLIATYSQLRAYKAQK